ncbi:MAG TPA: tetratricopeptide repeat protein [Candidatus Udaeobacter sp.]|nr:tetratricopeptide repeat protein [Candidatus Udaeobacter sp.]
MAVRHRKANNSKRQRERRPRELPGGVHNRGIVAGIYLLLAALSLAVFSQTIRYDFVNFDDDTYVYNAPAIQAGPTLQGMVAAFTTAHARNWHPLTTLSHMLDCRLYGLNAGGHHATNVVLHTIAALLLFRVLRQMTGGLWKSVIVAALFVIHPLHVESVAWVSERKDVLSAVFFFLMLDAYVRYARAASIRRYIVVTALFVAGLMSKPMLVTAPLVLLGLDYWPLRRFDQIVSTSGKSKMMPSGNRRPMLQRLILEKVPWLILSVGAAIVTFALQKRAAGSIPALPFLWRAQNAVVSYVIYAWKTLWPTRLAVFYPHPNDTLAIWQIALAIAFLLAITCAAIVFRDKRPYLFTGWLWYLVMLVPVIGFVQVGEQGHADRYTYLPSIGLFLIVVWAVGDVAAVSRIRLSRGVATAGTAMVIVALACTAFAQTSYWRNSETLWTHALGVTADNDVAHNNLGYLCVDRGELDKAMSHFEAALKIRSGKLDPHYNLGTAFVEMNFGDALARKGQPDEAMAHFEQAIKLQPDYAEAYYNRGNVLYVLGRTDEAIADWEKTLQIQPNDADAHTGLGNALLRKGRAKEAVAHYNQAMALAPKDAHCRSNMAWVLATASDASIRDGAKAIKLAQEAVSLSGGREPLFLRALAAAYAETGRFSDAIALAQQAAVIARMQGKTNMANRLDDDVLLYRGNIPIRRLTLGD